MKTIYYGANQVINGIDGTVAIERWVDEEGYRTYTVYHDRTGESATRDDFWDAISVLKRRIKNNERYGKK